MEGAQAASVEGVRAASVEGRRAASMESSEHGGQGWSEQGGQMAAGRPASVQRARVGGRPSLVQGCGQTPWRAGELTGRQEIWGAGDLAGELKGGQSGGWALRPPPACCAASPWLLYILFFMYLLGKGIKLL